MATNDADLAAAAWLDKAEEDLEAAGGLVDLGLWAAATFHAQQAAEKGLKAVQIHRHGSFDKVHDLWQLATRLKADAAIAEHCSELSGWYTASRYPDAGGAATEDDAREALSRAKEVVSWARTQLR